MENISILLLTAVSIGFIHTLVGPDHYLPFILMAKARDWSLVKTLSITSLCGIGHVIGSVALGVAGIVLGVAIGALEGIESFRGDLASWLLIGFGIAYTAWGIRIGWRAAEHTHTHNHNGQSHDHKHHHLGRHSHLHGKDKAITPWALFVIFVLGPCEPLIPILMYPAAAGSWLDVAMVAAAFGIVTILTMTGIVFLFYMGFARIKLDFMEKYVHAIAGLLIAISGLSIKVFGL